MASEFEEGYLDVVKKAFPDVESSKEVQDKLLKDDKLRSFVLKIAAAKNKAADAAGSIVEAMSPEETEKWLDEQITKKLVEEMEISKDSPGFEELKNEFKKNPAELGIEMPSENSASAAAEGYNGSMNKLTSSDDVIKLYDNIEAENVACQKYMSEIVGANDVDKFAETKKITDKAVGFTSARNTLVENDILGQEMAGLGKKDVNAVLRNTPKPEVVEKLLDGQQALVDKATSYISSIDPDFVKRTPAEQEAIKKLVEANPKEAIALECLKQKGSALNIESVEDLAARLKDSNVKALSENVLSFAPDESMDVIKGKSLPKVYFTSRASQEKAIAAIKTEAEKSVEKMDEKLATRSGAAVPEEVKARTTKAGAKVTEVKAKSQKEATKANKAIDAKKTARTSGNKSKAGEKAGQAVETVVKKAAKTQVGKAVAKTGKVVPKVVGAIIRSAGKKVPVLCIGLGVYEAYRYFKEGKSAQGALSLVSAAVGNFPPLAMTVGLSCDVTNAALDIKEVVGQDGKKPAKQKSLAEVRNPRAVAHQQARNKQLAQQKAKEKEQKMLAQQKAKQGRTPKLTPQQLAQLRQKQSEKGKA